MRRNPSGEMDMIWSIGGGERKEKKT